MPWPVESRGQVGGRLLPLGLGPGFGFGPGAGPGTAAGADGGGGGGGATGGAAGACGTGLVSGAGLGFTFCGFIIFTLFNFYFELLTNILAKA
jgi:hypothetical protein